MANPISFGDAYLAAKLALQLGRAFTKGRKSAPAEFREVENQLYSLSSALFALKDALSKNEFTVNMDPPNAQPRLAGSEETISVMLRSCEETLEHLKEIVGKYGCMVDPPDPQTPRLKRWKGDLKSTWMKVSWTKEGGDLATLRSKLTVHTNSLNLMLGVAINSQTSRVEDRVDQVAVMLKEIHDWFSANLKSTTPGSHSVRENSLTLEQSHPVTLQEFVFELYVDTGRREDFQLICGRASLHPKWKVKHSEAGARHLFRCHCNEGVKGEHSHQANIAAFTLSSLSFPVKLTGKERSYMLYKATDATNNRLVSLVIKRVPLNALSEFEGAFIYELAWQGANSMLGRGLRTMLAYSMPDAKDTHILHMIGNLNGVRKSVDSITFSSGPRSYTRASVGTIQLLHYKTVGNESLQSRSSDLATSSESYLSTAELVVHYSENDSQAGADVSLTTIQSANKLLQKLEEMRMELFVMSLQYPRPDERIVLKLQAGPVQSEVVQISDADITIVQNTETGRFRLIIVSPNGCSILSQELAEDFVSSLSIPGRRPNFTSRTFLVQVENTGKREVYRYERGFEYLDFSSAQTNRLFVLGLATISGSLPVRTPKDAIRAIEPYDARNALRDC
ncbi:uncharacterized protein Z518_10670 [Rhinocladiella mackenziei CBS 650.93]|uniref:Fungal N-terminal domain-containing protein n=1 Tax=Rhinocladiella mackenziei CBS 650.93 TaxID=1442369 RepID=A0A0D2IV18_9EURO|nr:uncharacterized protein Z518_10670 [Rhinocladiella mackenziei CBS 650.93]KIX00530.1 hypothetical protein Z518_10670 [Rhinocladiella mackenziei CBS 650.93]